MVGSEFDRAVGSIVNDVVIGVATTNGSGSQSANIVLLRALFAMGLPVSAKNLFPSNIAGLPTWYFLRVSEQGHPAPGPATHVGVLANPQTWVHDLEHIAPGGVVLANADIGLPIERDDLIVHSAPFTSLARGLDTRLHRKLASMVHVGVLTELLSIDPGLIHHAMATQFAGKARAIELNIQAIEAGRSWWGANATKQDPWTIQAREVNPDLILIEGNEAGALGAVTGGASVLAWYPITPSSSFAESTETYLHRLRKDAQTGECSFAVIQAEDEIAAIGMVLGAAWSGARAFTCTSGPGLSLMTEFTGYAAFAELPAVIWNIQRVGPSTGLPTRTQQADLIHAHRGGHGDNRHPVLLPGTVAECYEFGWRAFDIADRLQTIVIVLSDLDLGMNRWVTQRPTPPTQPLERGKLLRAGDLDTAAFADWGRYRDLDADGVPWRSLPGDPDQRSALLTRGSGHDEDARYTEDGEAYARNMARLAHKMDTARTILPAPMIDEPVNPGSTDLAILSTGSTDAVLREVRDLLADQGITTAHCRVRALPAHPDIEAFVARHPAVAVVELNRDGQLRDLLVADLPPELATHLHSVALTDGIPARATDIIAALAPLLPAIPDQTLEVRA